jgi:hypothetical protein
MKTPLYYGYHIVAASFLIQGVTIGGNFAYGVLFKELETEFGWSRATIAGASSASLLVMGFMATASATCCSPACRRPGSSISCTGCWSGSG